MKPRTLFNVERVLCISFQLLAMLILSIAVIKLIIHEITTPKIPIFVEVGIIHDSNYKITKDSLKAIVSVELPLANDEFKEACYDHAVQECGFSSRLYKENRNLFGMRFPTNRKTTALCERNGWAYYHTYKESIIDYCLWWKAKQITLPKTKREFWDTLAACGYL